MKGEEQWKQIQDLDYEVSNYGRVRRLGQPDRVLKPESYKRVMLSGHGKSRKRLVHQLVVEAFLDPPPTPEHVPNHKNGDHGDNRVENLEWTTPRENQLHAINTNLYGGRGETHGRAKLTEKQVVAIRQRYKGAYGEQTALAKEYGVSPDLIGKIVRAEVWTHMEDAKPFSAERHVRKGAKLRAEQVVEIRGRYTGGYGQQTALAREYDVPVTVIRKVVSGKSWQGTAFNGGPAFGEHHGRAKLTDRQVRRIRRYFDAGDTTVNKLAERYGVGRQILRDIVYRKTWKHID